MWVFGKCHPTDCDQGQVNLITYGRSVQDTDHMAATAVCHLNFANNLLTMLLGGTGHNQINL